MMTDLSSLIGLASVVTTIGGAYLTLRKIKRDAEKSKMVEAAKILHSAKEEDALIKAKLEARIERINTELAHMKLDIAKDIQHLKENYSREIEILGSKVEEIRDEFRNSHSQLVQLLTKILEDRD